MKRENASRFQTSNVERPTLNGRCFTGRWKLSVERWTFSLLCSKTRQKNAQLTNVLSARRNGLPPISPRGVAKVERPIHLARGGRCHVDAERAVRFSGSRIALLANVSDKSTVISEMNSSLFLHVVERLEGLVHRLPATIQKPILSELTPLKELFLKQRSPRFAFTGSENTPLPQIMAAIFPDFAPADISGTAHRKDHWRDYTLHERGTISILDARGSELGEKLAQELEAEPADVIFFVEDEDRKKMRKEPIENLVAVVDHNRRQGGNAGVIGIIYEDDAAKNGKGSTEADISERASRLLKSLESKLKDDAQVLRIVAARPGQQSERSEAVIAAIARHLPNEARIETARVFGHHQTQQEIAHLLVKSTTAICTAIGAQPIPLADLPVLTTLQLVMVSGIMYLSGRERSLRAATEFVAALGANVGAGMLFREGARALLKLVPGWGNVVCGMIAGAGTYAVGRAAIAYFLEGVSLKDARRTYLSSRKRSAQRPAPALPEREKRLSLPAPKSKNRLRLRS